MRLLITSGHSRSNYTIAILSELKRNGFIDLECVQVRTFQLKRFKFYVKQYGLKIVFQKFKAHFYAKQGKNKIFNETVPIRNYVLSQSIHDKSVKQFCKRNHIRFSLVSNLNNFRPKNREYDLIIYTGGGIIKKSFLQIPKIGIINAHSGPLPLIRGMNAIEWSLFNNIRPKTTVHFIDKGIDTGGIILSEEIPWSNDLYTLRGNAVVQNVELLIKVVKDELYKEFFENNSSQIGKQYFVMHPILKKYLNDKMKNSNFYETLDN